MTVMDPYLAHERSHRKSDPDAIAWVLDHGDAPWNEDGTGPQRDVWDVHPVNGNGEPKYGYSIPIQRWENSEFVPLNSADAYAAFRREGCGRWKSWRLARRARRMPPMPPEGRCA